LHSASPMWTSQSLVTMEVSELLQKAFETAARNMTFARMAASPSSTWKPVYVHVLGQLKFLSRQFTGQEDVECCLSNLFHCANSSIAQRWWARFLACHEGLFGSAVPWNWVSERKAVPRRDALAAVAGSIAAAQKCDDVMLEQVKAKAEQEKDGVFHLWCCACFVVQTRMETAAPASGIGTHM